MYTLCSSCQPKGGVNFNDTIICFLLISVLAVPFIHAEIFNSAARIQTLQDPGWDETTTAKVVHSNQGWFANLAVNAPKEFDAQLARLGRWGQYPPFAFLLQKHPEWTGLLAGSENPRLLAKTRSDEGCCPCLTQQYSLQTVPDDALALIMALCSGWLSAFV